MTAEEEALLVGYLTETGEITGPEDFSGWYSTVRDGSESGEAEYREVLALAGSWWRGYRRGRAAAQPGPRQVAAPERHYHVMAYRDRRRPDKPLPLIAVPVSGGYRSRSSAYLAASRRQGRYALFGGAGGAARWSPGRGMTRGRRPRRCVVHGGVHGPCPGFGVGPAPAMQYGA